MSESQRYRTIVADPPWPYEDGWPGWGLTREDRMALPYPAMTLEEIRALPIQRLIANPGGCLFLWTTNRYIEDAYGIVRDWNLLPQQLLVWCKPPRGKGPGGLFATTTEFVIVARPRSHAREPMTRAEMVRAETSWFQWPRGAHSVKPDAFLDLVERVSPGPYAELFARRARFGWDYPIGDQVLGGAAA